LASAGALADSLEALFFEMSPQGRERAGVSLLFALFDGGLTDGKQSWRNAHHDLLESDLLERYFQEKNKQFTVFFPEP